MVTLFSLADAAYFKYIKALVKSSRKYFPKARFCVFLVNVTKKHLRQLDGVDCIIKTEKKKFKSDREKRCYCASRRGYIFTQLRKEHPDDHLVWIDSDSVFIKNASSIFKKHILSCDVSMRPKSLKQGKFASAVIVSGPKSIDFFNEYYKKINDRMKLYEWTSDQKMLNLTYREFKNKINFKPLPRMFCDVWYSDKGVLWVAKGKCRDDNRYQREMKKWI